MDAFSRRKAALDAISAVQSGQRAGDVESEIVDFKQEAGRVDRDGPSTINPRDERAAQALAGAAACMAMSEHGGIIVVGVDDKKAGSDAFVGAYLDTDWLRERIYALTQPNLALDVIEEIETEGRRLYLINVPPALSDTWSGGKLRRRMGTDCVELHGDDARRFLERRRRYDWSAEDSQARLSDIEEHVLEVAHARYSEQGRAAPSDVELIRRMGIAADDSDDPRLSVAGALLLTRYEPGVERLDVRVAKSEGAVSSVRERLEAPLLLAYERAWELIRSAFPASQEIVGEQRRTVRAIPERALREAIANAIMHRDYRLPQSSVIVSAIGEPPVTLRVVSPGVFPEGVDAERLLATRSRPRNRALAEALRVLGLAEREGVGIGAMYRVMLRDGHAHPDIFAESGDVVCRLPGGRIDPDIRAFFDGLFVADGTLEEDVRAHIAVTELMDRTPLRPERLAEVAQCSEDEALDALTRLAHAGAVERLLDGSRSFRFSSPAREALARRIQYRHRTSIDEHWDVVRAYLDRKPQIGSSAAAEILNVGNTRASQLLSQFHKERGWIEPVGKSRGRGVRYKLSENAPD